MPCVGQAVTGQVLLLYKYKQGQKKLTIRNEGEHIFSQPAKEASNQATRTTLPYQTIDIETSTK